MEAVGLHIIWGEVPTSLYRSGVIDQAVRNAHAYYQFKSTEEAKAFIYGIQEAIAPSVWAIVSNLPDQRALGMPERSKLITAILKGDLKSVEEALDNGLDPDVKAPNGMTALQIAAQEGRAEIAQKLLDKGAHSEPQETYGNHSALHSAISSTKNDHLRTTEILAQESNNLDAQNKAGMTALGFAISIGALQKATILLDNGANPNLPDGNGNRPVQIMEETYGSNPSNAEAYEFSEALNQKIIENERAIDLRKRGINPQAPTPYGRQTY